MIHIKRVIIGVILFGILIGCLHSQVALADASWRAAYRKFLNNPDSKVYGMKIADYDGKIKFEIKDMNKDGIPELIFDISLYYGDQCPEVLYTFYNGKVKCVGEAGHAGFFYRFNSSKVFQVEAYKWGSVYFTYYHYYKLSKGKMKLVASHIVDCGNDGTGNKNSYEISGKKSNKVKFINFLNKNKCNGKKIRVGSKYAITSGNIEKAIKKGM